MCAATTLGNYDVFEEIDDGPYGIVFRGKNRGTDQAVALKFIKKDYWEARFLRLQKLDLDLIQVAGSHPHLVEFYECAQIDHMPVVATEYLAGGNLRDWIANRRVSPGGSLAAEVIQIGLQIADGLGYLHRKNFNHGNLKPTNVLFSAEGQVKLSDCGLHILGEDFEVTRDLDLMKGPYLSPEQQKANGLITPATDVYSLGMLLYEMLTGTCYLDALAQNAPAPAEIPDIPEALAVLLGAMLDIDPTCRPTTGYTVKTRLAKINLTAPVALEPPPALPKADTGERKTRPTHIPNGDVPVTALAIGGAIRGEKAAYQILSLLGQGGFGFVYKVQTVDPPNTHCVLKIIRVDTEGKKRHFDFEVRVLAELTHPGLPKLLDHFTYFDEQKLEYRCMVMDFVGDTNLESYCRLRIEQGSPLAVDEILKWVNQLCDTLTLLHAQTPPIIHRDIKPANIVLTADLSQVKLVDFGTSKEFHPGRTTTTAAMGFTDGYSSPEQYGTGETTAASDIYSLGATLYYLLTGEHPDNSVTIMQKQFSTGKNAVPQVKEKRPELPPHLNDAIFTAMQPQSENRFATIEQLRTALTNKRYRAHITSKSTVGLRINLLALLLFAIVGGAFLVAQQFSPPMIVYDPTLLARVQQLEGTEKANQQAIANAQNSATLEALRTVEAGLSIERTQAAKNLEFSAGLTSTAATVIARQTGTAAAQLTFQANLSLTPSTSTPTTTPTPPPTPTFTPTLTPTRTLTPHLADPPTAPSLASPAHNASFAGGATITLDWNSSLGATSYYAEYYGASSGNSGWTSATSLNLSSLAAGSYTWRAKARNANGESAWSNSWFYSVIQSPPDIPALSSPANNAVVATGTGFSFNWSAAARATEYYAEFSGSSSWNSGWTSTTSYGVSSLNAGSYTWRVKARNSGGESGWSATWSVVAQVKPSTPALSSPVSGATVTPGSVTLRWNTAANATQYYAQYSGPTSGNTGWITATSANVTLSAGTYSWQVKSRNSAGESSLSGAWTISVVSLPAAPALSSPVNGATATQGTVTFRWAAVSGATGYILEHTGASNGNSGWITATSYSISAPVGSISWHVKAHNAAGESAWSATWSMTVQAPPSNLLSNPGFESDFANWAWPTVCSKAIYTSGAHGGSKLLATGKSNSYPNCQSVYQNMYVSGNTGETFTIMAWLKSPWGAQSPLDMALWNMSAGTSNHGKVTVTGLDNSWRCYQAVLTLTQPTSWIKAEVYLPNINMDVQIDDVYVTRGTYNLCP